MQSEVRDLHDQHVELLIYACSILRSGVVVSGPAIGGSNDELIRALSITLDSALPTTTPSSLSTSPTLSTESRSHHGSDDDLTRHASSMDQGCWALKQHPSRRLVQAAGQGDVDGVPDEAADGMEEAVQRGKTQIQIPDPEVDLQDNMHHGVKVGLQDCCKQAKRANLDVTAKFFYLVPPAPSQRHLDSGASGSESGEGSSGTRRFDPKWTQNAMQELKRATGLETVDTFIVSLPGLTYDDEPEQGGCTSHIKVVGDDHSRSLDRRPVTDDEIFDIWKEVSTNPSFLTLGVSDFSQNRLERLDKKMQEQEEDGSHSASSSQHSTPWRKPRLNQINIRGPAPTELNTYTKSQGIELFSHSDCSNILPPSTFATVLNAFAHRMPEDMVHAIAKASIPTGSGESDQREVRLQPLWVVKYTVVIKDRSVVADKGYVVCVSSV